MSNKSSKKDSTAVSSPAACSFPSPNTLNSCKQREVLAESLPLLRNQLLRQQELNRILQCPLPSPHPQEWQHLQEQNRPNHMLHLEATAKRTEQEQEEDRLQAKAMMKRTG